MQSNLKILFIINSVSGNNTTDWSGAITDYFKTSNHEIILYSLPKDCNVQIVKEQIKLHTPNLVVAVGGDGTIKLVAECLLLTNIPLGIIPAGSANGLAKELGIGNTISQALDVLEHGQLKRIHLTTVNQHLCIHLSDVGLNAYAMKKFEKLPLRGMWGYIKAFLHVLWKNPKMEIEMEIEKQSIKIIAEMVVIANATKYGSGALINPIGKLDDDVFEVIAIKKISFREIFKMMYTHQPYNTEKTEIFQAKSLYIKSKKKIHFQVDGEYLGKVRIVNAEVIPHALDILVPVA